MKNYIKRHQNLKLSLANVSLRVAGIIPKFLLVIFIASFLTLEELGSYSLFTISMMYATLFIGLDFYTYSNRIIAGQEVDKVNLYVMNQGILSISLYIFFLPFIIMIGYLLDLDYITYFSFILFFEYLTTELYRVLTVLNNSLEANILYFIKSGLWCIPLLLILAFPSIFHTTPSLDLIYFVWLLGTIVAFAYGISFYIISFRPSVRDLKLLKKKWFVDGARVASFFIVGTMLNKFVEFGGRYIIDFFMSEAEVGIYSFYAQIASMINILVFTASAMILYPHLIRTYKEKDMALFHATEKKLSNQMLLYSLIAGIVAILSTYPIVVFISKKELLSHYPVLFLMVFNAVIFNLSWTSHFVLYTFKEDKTLLLVSLIVFLVNTILILSAIYLYKIDIYVVTIIQTLSYISLLASKYLYARGAKHRLIHSLSI